MNPIVLKICNMAIKETHIRYPSNTIDKKEIEGASQEIVFSILEKYKKRIPVDVWLTSLNKIDKAFEEFEAPKEQLGGQATSAFFVHTRRNKNGSIKTSDSSVFRYLDDSSRYFPILDPKYGIPENEVEKLWNSLPPFKVGEISGFIDDQKINCIIISVPITPKTLGDYRSATERVNYVRPRISQAAKLAEKMGARIIGLGETLASLTMHGKKLQEQFPEIKIATGHAFTTYFMTEWTNFIAEKIGINLKDSQVTIIGANGSIGSAMTEMLLEQGVSALRLHDQSNMLGALEKRKKEISNKYLNRKIEITGGNENLREACRNSRIILVAASSPIPFIKAQHLDKNTFVINDSQPPSITREEAQRANSVTLWIAGTLPKELINTFNSGLIEGDWTCALEVIALEMDRAKTLETVGPVTPQRAKKAGEIAKRLNMTLTSPQSWGVKEDIKLQ